MADRHDAIVTCQPDVFGGAEALIDLPDVFARLVSAHVAAMQSHGALKPKS